MLNARSLLCGLALTLVAAGCATTGTGPAATSGPAAPSGPTATPMSRNAEPPPPNVNLSGFPLPYRQGYADGCASASGPERKDTTRFAAEGNYRVGWQDGLALCRKK